MWGAQGKEWADVGGSRKRMGQAISIQKDFSLCVLQLGVLHNVLEKLQNRRMAVWERRQSHLPSCIVGDYCTVKKGPRYGQLCDCPRGSKCNLFFLKCL
uniref:Cocaine- and amphetamine-regulated transcript protein n=1 Tax=Oncorhynchus mykiss TaxID=8022 RepID=A0A8C7VQW3_ONCMY